jgi:hypothetical protein
MKTKIPAEHLSSAVETDAILIDFGTLHNIGRMSSVDRLIVNNFYNQIYHRGEDGRLEAANNWHRSLNL